MTSIGECPSCRKHCLVQKSDTVYVCLGCDFKKDLNPPPAKKEPPNLGVLAAIGIAIFLILSLLGRLRPQPTNSGQPASFSPTRSTIVNPAIESQNF
jgi:hypothetical protein